MMRHARAHHTLAAPPATAVFTGPNSGRGQVCEPAATHGSRSPVNEGRRAADAMTCPDCLPHVSAGCWLLVASY